MAGPRSPSVTDWCGGRGRVRWEVTPSSTRVNAGAVDAFPIAGLSNLARLCLRPTRHVAVVAPIAG
jgi:hypothetical protein